MFHEVLGHYEGLVGIEFGCSKARCYQHGGGALVSVTFLLPLINGILGTHMAPPVPVATLKLPCSPPKEVIRIFVRDTPTT